MKEIVGEGLLLVMAKKRNELNKLQGEHTFLDNPIFGKWKSQKSVSEGLLCEKNVRFNTD